MNQSEKERQQHVVGLLSLDRRTIDSFDADQLSHTIELVEEVRIEAVKEGRFLDADNAKKMLKLLREAFEKSKKKELKSQNAVQLQKLEEDFQREVADFTESWNQKIASYQEQCQRLEEEHLAGQKRAVEECRAQLEEGLPTRPKDSTRLLELKARIEQLVKIQEYKDAHYVQQKAHELERRELEKFEAERAKKIENLLVQRLGQLETEYNALRVKVYSGLDELETQRKNEYDRIFLKFNNLRKNMESKQSMVSNMVQRSMKMASLNQSLRPLPNVYEADRNATKATEETG